MFIVLLSKKLRRFQTIVQNFTDSYPLLKRRLEYGFSPLDGMLSTFGEGRTGVFS